MAVFGRLDYNWTTLPEIIGEDEPVIVFRAKDENLPDIIEYYKQLIEGTETDDEGGFDDDDKDAMLESLEEFLGEVKEWQEKNEDDVHTPDL